MKCAGIHRGLGTHISKVRSCSLDTWLPEQVLLMEQTGNASANAFYESRLPQVERSGAGKGEGRSRLASEPELSRPHAQSMSCSLHPSYGRGSARSGITPLRWSAS
jgi:hypothetical protein